MYWYLLLAVVLGLLQLVLSVNVVLHKKDTRAAMAWLGLIWMSPGVGALLYVMFGINRIARAGRRMRLSEHCPSGVLEVTTDAARLGLQAVGDQGDHLKRLAMLVGKVTGASLLYGNRVRYLASGEVAYQTMLDEIEGAQHCISMSSYIFDRDPQGNRFVEALAKAVERGVEVRVLIDGVGARYSFPTIVGTLRKRNIPTALFNASCFPTRFVYRNLRNHRKLLIVDGSLGFTGGMNIRQGHCHDSQAKDAILDAHFRLAGPIAGHLQQAFAVDWAFSTGEVLDESKWFPYVEPEGPVLARGIPDGPDEDLDKIRMAILGAIGCAQNSILIASPYFLPDSAMIAALSVAAMRGVEVDILLPAKNNLPFVHWASISLIRQLLEHRCRVWLSPPPFDHTKLMVVDDLWAMLGSANLDPRSLRLNFELNVECYEEKFAREMGDHLRGKRATAEAISIEQIDSRNLPTKIRDGIVRLASPYL